MAQEVESQIVSLLRDLKRQVTYLEKKIDMLVAQPTVRHSSAKSYSQEPRTYEGPSSAKGYSQGPRTYGGGPKRYNKDNRENSFGMKNAQTGRSFEKNRSDEGRGFPKKNKPFNPTRKKRSGKSK